ncbi:MAG: hypothetical protein OEZ08_10345, partial [Betaproteobacteria bacterium]|nr:hypothetical protein [Betaproteobacteria bacterium]
GSDGDTAYDVYGQRYDSFGRKVGGEILVSTANVTKNQGVTSGTSFAPLLDVAGSTEGGFMSVWAAQARGGEYQYGTTPSATGATTGGSWNIKGTRYDATGASVTTDVDGTLTKYGAQTVFDVNRVWSNLNQSVKLISMSDGGYVALWEHDKGLKDASGWGITGMRFDKNGVRMGLNNPAYGEDMWQFTVPANTSGNQGIQSNSGTWIVSLGASELFDAQGNSIGFVATYTGGDGNVYFRRFTSGSVGTNTTAGADNSSSTGTKPVAVDLTDQRVNVDSANTQGATVVAGLASGGFVVAWSSDHVIKGNFDVYLRRYAADGSALDAQDIRVNTSLVGNQGMLQGDVSSQLDITALAGGGFVLVWAGGTSSGDNNVWMRVYNRDGSARTAETMVPTATKGNQALPTVEALSDGGYIISWTSQYADVDKYGIQFRTYNADGSVRGLAMDPNDSFANGAATGISADQAGSQFGARIEAAGGGNFVISYTSTPGSTNRYPSNAGGGADTKAYLYDSAGNKIMDLSPPNLANDNGLMNSNDAAGATHALPLSNGNYVIARESDANSDDVLFTLLNAAGTPIVTGVSVGQTQSAEQHLPRLAEMRDATGAGTGNFAVLFTDHSSGRHLPYVRLYSGTTGVALTNAIQVTQHTGTDQAVNLGNGGGVGMDIAAGKGKFLVTWTDYGSTDIYARLLNSDGTAAANEFVLNTFTTNSQTGPRVAALADGSYQVAWVSNKGGTTTFDIVQQRVSASGNTVGYSESNVAATTAMEGVYDSRDLENTENHMDIAALANGGYVVTYTVGGRNGTPTDTDILANVYDPMGNLVQAGIQVNKGTLGTQILPSVTGTSYGGFVVSWTNNDTTALASGGTGDASGSAVQFRRFDADGRAIAGYVITSSNQPVAVEPNLNLSGASGAPTGGTADSGDTQIYQATVVINGVVPGDVLGATLSAATTGNIVQSWDATSGTLTLAVAGGGLETLAHFENALRTVTFKVGDINNTVTGERQITFDLMDEAGATFAVDSSVVVAAPVSYVTGTAGAETLAGGLGSDTLNTMGGADTVNAGASDDYILIRDGLATINGGQGADTVIVNANALTLNLADVKWTNIEKIQLGTTDQFANANTLLVGGGGDVSKLLDGVSSLRVMGNSSDTVDLGNNGGSVSTPALGNWVQGSQPVAIEGVVYDRYVAGGQDLLIQEGINVI